MASDDFTLSVSTHGSNPNQEGEFNQPNVSKGKVDKAAADSTSSPSEPAGSTYREKEDS